MTVGMGRGGPGDHGHASALKVRGRLSGTEVQEDREPDQTSRVEATQHQASPSTGHETPMFDGSSSTSAVAANMVDLVSDGTDDGIGQSIQQWQLGDTGLQEELVQGAVLGRRTSQNLHQVHGDDARGEAQPVRGRPNGKRPAGAAPMPALRALAHRIATGRSQNEINRTTKESSSIDGAARAPRWQELPHEGDGAEREKVQYPAGQRMRQLMREVASWRQTDPVAPLVAKELPPEDGGAERKEVHQSAKQRMRQRMHKAAARRQAQRAIYKMCSDAAAAGLRVESSSCWIEDFKSFLEERGEVFPTCRFCSFDQAVQEFLEEHPARRADIWLDSSDKVVATVISFAVDHGSGTSEVLQGEKRWRSYVTRQNAAAESTANGAWATSVAWVDAEAHDEALASSWRVVLVTLLLLSVVGLVYTMDFRMTGAVLGLTFCCVVVLHFLMYCIFQWDFGPWELVITVVFLCYAMEPAFQIGHLLVDRSPAEPEGAAQDPEREASAGGRAPPPGQDPPRRARALREAAAPGTRRKGCRSLAARSTCGPGAKAAALAPWLGRMTWCRASPGRCTRWWGTRRWCPCSCGFAAPAG
ncbi:unnamed protein product, partial [Prorocentrum cordatum]